MGDTTIPGGGGTPNNHGFHVYGSGQQGHQGGPASPGFVGHEHGPRGFGNGGWGTNHGHVGGANAGTSGYRFGGHPNGGLHGERFGGQHQGGLGHDTINLGSGHDTLVDAGRAAGAHFGYHVSSHSATMAGGAHHTNFIGGAHSMHHGAGSDSATGASHHVTALFAHHNVGTDVIKNFVTGHDKLYLEGKSMSYLHSHVDVTVTHGQTHISLDGGHTTVALKGFTHVASTDTTHKG
jgi:hypothetical protein